jgi:two-component system, OmpR family, sensor kinase
VLEEAFGRLHEAWLRQARFTAAASHELRTPLAVIRSQAEVALRHERTPQVYKEALTVVVDGAVRLQETLDGLLLLARADAGALSQERAPVCLSDLVDAAITRLTPLHPDGPSILRVGSDSGLIDGDARQLEVLLQNLLTNAVRHTESSGRITVALWVEARHVGLAVEDTGEGIPPDVLPRVFDRFFRVDLHRSRGHGGSGLGLSIVQAIAVAHGGTVEVRSTLGVGTRFEVRLPRADLKPS